MPAFNARGSLFAGLLAGIGASVCCVGPLVLLALGIGGAWVATLTALEPYRPIFIGLTVLFLGLTYRKLHRRPEVCAPGAACIEPRVQRRQRQTFWVVSVVVAGLFVTPYLAPLFY
ncbi:MAG: mercuric transporter MerT family protein [Casimicrobiaceae bacterium]